MRKEFGSFLEESTTKGINDISSSKYFEEMILFRSAREALFVIAQKESDKETVLIPSLCCSSMIQPFEQIGMNVVFYKINDNLTIDEDDVKSKLCDNSIVYVMNYYGIVAYKELFEIIKSFNNIKTIQDCTQHVFTKDLFDDRFDYHVGSIRKWVGIPDGAFLKGVSSVVFPEIQDDIFTKKMYEAMQLKSEYEITNSKETKDKFRENYLFCMKHLREKVIPQRISATSLNILNSDISLDYVISRRSSNYEKLVDIISKYHPEVLKYSVEQACPLCLPILVNDRDVIQEILAKKNIFCQVLWPLSDGAKKTCEFADYFSSHMLAVPCDQRYTVQDMEYIGNSINEII